MFPGDPRFPYTSPLGQDCVPSSFTALARAALAEDLADGDATTLATVPRGATGRGVLVARAGGVVSGVDAARAVLVEAAEPAFAAVLGGTVALTGTVSNGTVVAPGDVVGELTGPVRAVLQLERTVLNMLTHASGVATLTAAWVAAVDAAAPEGHHVAVRDSRKTLPGLRLLEKRAVVHGGGVPHRYNLSDQAMVKDNHVTAGGGVVDAYRALRAARPELWCEVEVDDLAQLRAVLAVKNPPQQVLLDNFTVEDTAEAVALRGAQAPGVLLESSGGLTLDVVGSFASTGVDSVAVGGLTHSAAALDIGLDLV
ncbi:MULTISPECIES: carboxylating nicotinate-nucleotide diphosphorylase [Corynebacterium]|jgi:nicotinate-nucleotide pyrophosphorylase (carboxylating)|uniref:Nicotinate-nucleotide pyrophosphorylase [carboxylating] n=1 Tax=Corynebacterium provencense TaxID=1737425 RepID=A0A2Z3YQE6_9CORY|nr:Nicotinate-nucleotide pyrophosphorylase [carboxylating] [Corynebacterium provencense]